MSTGKRLAGLLAALGLALASPVFAANPETEVLEAMPAHRPGHIPADLLLPLKAPTPAELPKRGKVVGLITADSYAFVEVEGQSGRQWIAGPLVPMQVGDTIGYSDGSVMRDFYSKTLGRSFDSLLFADHVMVLPAGN